MGYTTEFTGSLTLNKRLTEEDSKFLKDFNATRRMKRNLEGYGIDGEFFVGILNDYGQDETPDIVDYNSPPSTQPSLWCNWVPTEDDMGLEWDGGEKAYCMEIWIVYLINRYLEPRGYVVNGEVEAQGEERGDVWTLKVEDNVVKVCHVDVISMRKNSVFTEVNYDNAPKLAPLVKELPKKKLSTMILEKIEKDEKITIECKRDSSSNTIWVSQESILNYLNHELKVIGKPSIVNANVRVILKYLIEQFKSL